MGKIWIAGKGFETDANIIRWDEGPGYDAAKEVCINSSQPCQNGIPFEMEGTRRRRYGLRPSLSRYGKHPPLGAAQAAIKQFIFHHDGCASAKMCFNVLHNERGYSAHFLIDNDGTIYQTLDLSMMAYHAAKFNSNSIGVEICNRGNAKKEPNYYSKKRQQRDVTTCRIHDHTYLAFKFTEVQERALRELAKGLSHALPNLPLEYPQESPGRQSWGVLPNVRKYSGYLGHYHTTTRKWDPGPFDFKKFCQDIRGSMCFPVAGKAKKPPVIPQDNGKLNEQSDKLYRKSEERDGSGYFPVGRFGKSRLWHGGIHMPGTEKDKVYAVFPGRIVAARFKPNSPAGSQNFVLVRHDLSFGEKTERFYSLYYHLYNEVGAKSETPEWVDKAKTKLSRGNVVLLDIPIQGGESLGRVGKAGPDFKEELHFEIFSPDEVFGKAGESTWKVIDGTAGGRFCDNSEVLTEIDESGDGKLSRKELLDFFRGSRGDKNAARFYVTLHASEWCGRPDWDSSLKQSPSFQELSETAYEDLLETQIKPSLWWTDSLAAHAKLPRDGVVFHYHPLSFLKYVTEKVIEANALADNGVGAFSVQSAEEPPPGVTDDFGDVSGESFLDATELAPVDLGHHLTLEDLVNGYPEE